jgi:hypothetical protein
MAGVLKGFLKLLAVVIALAPFVAARLFFGTTSLAVVAPVGWWMLAAFFVVPVVLGIVLWKLSAIVR